MEHGRESSSFAYRLKFMKRMRKPDKRRSTTMPINTDVPSEGPLGQNNADSEMVAAKITESQDKFAKSLTDENDSLRNKNTTLRYQLELLNEKVTDLRDLNMDLRNQNSRIREENSILRNERTQLSARNDCLVEQLIVLRKMLEDMGVSLDDATGCALFEGDIAENPTDYVDGGDETVSCNGNSGTPASFRKPPLHCDNNLNFL